MTAPEIHLADDYDAIAPQPHPVTIDGETLTLTPITVGQLPTVMRALRGVNLERLADTDLQGLIDLIADHGDAIVTAVAAASRQTPERVAALDLMDFIGLLTAVIEVNADFFALRVAPAIALTRTRLHRITLRAGPGLTRSST